MTATTDEVPRYRVLAPYITARVGGLGGIIPGARGGYGVCGFYAGAVLPADVPAEQVARLLRRGLIEAVE